MPRCWLFIETTICLVTHRDFLISLITILFIAENFFKNTSLILGWRRQWHPTPVLLPGKSHGQRSLVGCSPWGRWESDTTERLHFDFSLSSIGEGNGNPLQCSCLENPRDGGAWWAAVYGIAQSRTRLKWLSIAILGYFEYSGFLYLCIHIKFPLDWLHFKIFLTHHLFLLHEFESLLYSFWASNKTG